MHIRIKKLRKLMTKNNELGMLRKRGVIAQEVIKDCVSEQKKNNRNVHNVPQSIQKYL